MARGAEGQREAGSTKASVGDNGLPVGLSKPFQRHRKGNFNGNGNGKGNSKGNGKGNSLNWEEKEGAKAVKRGDCWMNGARRNDLCASPP